MAESTPKHIDVLLTKSEQMWFAHGLQVDVAGQGESIREALEQLQFALAATLVLEANPDPVQERSLQEADPAMSAGPMTIPKSIGQAPQKYWQMFESAAPLLLDSAPKAPEVQAANPVSLPELREARVS